ncbi:hypothetical protein BDW71DRAFT_170587 [Aspergillus fruticulosus]
MLPSFLYRYRMDESTDGNLTDRSKVHRLARRDRTSNPAALHQERSGKGCRGLSGS